MSGRKCLFGSGLEANENLCSSLRLDDGLEEEVFLPIREGQLCEVEGRREQQKRSGRKNHCDIVKKEEVRRK